MIEQKQPTKPKRYLYGASVQGIQDFIFQTNKLKEIIGASDLVSKICTTVFSEMVGNEGKIVRAAGKIKHLFESKDQCDKVVRNFPKKVMLMAPGITISQAVVEYSDDAMFGDKIDELENKLRAQRNKPTRSITQGLLGVARSQQTGLPIIYGKSNGNNDIASMKKLANCNNVIQQNLCQKNFGDDIDETKLVFDISQITAKNDWIAIIHIDGNGLGAVVQAVGKNREVFTDFSSKLDEATQSAAQAAFESLELEKGKPIPMRPIVLSGDDHTIICRADLALRYVENFLQKFEEETIELTKNIKEGDSENKISFQNLTACAGIAYIKSKYPFHYGYSLAESLCTQAKVKAKQTENLKDGIARSCVMFHKVQDSFIEDYSKIKQRELSVGKNISLSNGPYYLKKETDFNQPTIDELRKNITELDDSTKRHLREWLLLLNNNINYAKQKLDRLMLLNDKKSKIIKDVTAYDNIYINEKQTSQVAIYDILVIDTVENQTIKNDDEKH